jgi:hypothetical protein
MMILRVRHAETSEERHESGHPIDLGVSITVRSHRRFIFVSCHPQFIDGSSTGFQQAPPNQIKLSVHP